MKNTALYRRSISAVAIASFAGVAAFAATPEAGSVIGNQAVATYKNTSGDTITVTSNKVETIVQQVAGVTLTSDNSEYMAAGGKAFLPHVVTNDGNGSDKFILSIAEGANAGFEPSYVIYADANMDGVADSSNPITETPVLAAGEQFGFVIEATARSTDTGIETLTVDALSELNRTIVDTNTDTLEISTGPIVEVVKSMTVDPASGPGNDAIVDAGDTVAITLTYSSTGLAAATNYSIQDVLDPSLTFTDNSATWSDAAGILNDTNNVATADATNGNGDEIRWNKVSANEVHILIDNVPSGRSGSVSFEATINDGAPAGIIPNTATQSVNGVVYPDSNTAQVTVDSVYALSLDDRSTNLDGTRNTTTVSSTDTDATGNDVVQDNGTYFQGGTIPFEFVLTNRSNQPDTFALDYDATASILAGTTDFPAGTTFRIVGSDGVTPVVGSVGPLAVGESTTVYLLATLPSDAAPVAAANYAADLIATSEASGATSDPSTANFTGVVAASAVDLTNDVAGSEGTGPNPTDTLGDPWVQNATDPGVATTFEMLVGNNGGTSDSYNLALGSALPAGWTVEFQLADGTVVSNTGTIPAGGTKAFNVVLTPPAGQAPGDTLFDIAITSAVSGQGDVITNQVTVREVIDVAIVAGQSTQAAPGGVVDMLHTVTNNSNIDITEGDILQSGLTNFSGAIYWDVDGDGAVSAADVIVDNFDDLTANIDPNGIPGDGDEITGLAAGETMTLIYRVQTPSTATPGISEIGTISLDTTLNGAAAKADSDTSNNSVEDRVVIVSGDLTLIKYQYVDAGCAGAAGTFTKLRQEADPGDCIRYRVEAENTGSFDATEVVIKDIAPAYTTIVDCGGLCPTVATGGTTQTVTSAQPNISSAHGTVLPGSTAVLEFSVQIDP